MTLEQAAWALLGLLTIAIGFWLDIRREGWPWQS